MMCVKEDLEYTMWSVAPVSIIQLEECVVDDKQKVVPVILGRLDSVVLWLVTCNAEDCGDDWEHALIGANGSLRRIWPQML